MTLTKTHKIKVRLFILRQLYESERVRNRLNLLASAHGMDSLEAMEFYENELARIDQLFNWPLPSQYTD
jgi:hypothetical protein